MADDRHYVGGDNYILDDLSGFKIRASKARIIPGGITGNLAVAPKRWEPQQPQDFVTGVPDDQTVALARPRQRNQFVIVGTIIVAPSLRQSVTITVEDVTGFQVASLIQIMLDSGENMRTQIAGINGNVFTLTNPLTSSVGLFYGAPIENSVLLIELAPLVGPFVLDTSDGVLDINVLA